MEIAMPGKKRFTKKEDRQAKHVADSMMKTKHMSPEKAKSVGFAVVNKLKNKKKKSK